MTQNLLAGDASFYMCRDSTWGGVRDTSVEGMQMTEEKVEGNSAWGNSESPQPSITCLCSPLTHPASSLGTLLSFQVFFPYCHLRGCQRSGDIVGSAS